MAEPARPLSLARACLVAGVVSVAGGGAVLGLQTVRAADPGPVFSPASVSTSKPKPPKLPPPVQHHHHGNNNDPNPNTNPAQCSSPSIAPIACGGGQTPPPTVLTEARAVPPEHPVG